MNSREQISRWNALPQLDTQAPSSCRRRGGGEEEERREEEEYLIHQLQRTRTHKVIQMKEVLISGEALS